VREGGGRAVKATLITFYGHQLNLIPGFHDSKTDYRIFQFGGGIHLARRVLRNKEVYFVRVSLT